MLSKAKHLSSVLVCPTNDSEILRFAQNDKVVSALTIQRFKD